MMLETVRIDKFLWSVRLFKTRTLAAEECEKHHVLVNGAEVKPSRNVKLGDVLTVKKPPIVCTYKVIQLLDRRLAAPLIKDYITDTTTQEELDRAATAQMTAFVKRDRGAGRPTKKERRDMEKISPQ